MGKQEVETASPSEPTDEQLREAFTLDSGGPNPFYRCKACGETEPGLRTYLVDHWQMHVALRQPEAQPVPASQTAGEPVAGEVLLAVSVNKVLSSEQVKRLDAFLRRELAPKDRTVGKMIEQEIKAAAYLGAFSYRDFNAGVQWALDKGVSNETPSSDHAVPDNHTSSGD